ncbi:hypothetical protein PYH37_000522 [Sinorhizobium numidicum]|uniref:Uncharacterized protein n=1 Tax=Sinorhizobium numidicum TaxID=680248 RepID=A0ABY8CR75_9HYPH|nr:hypothetical protein [Sinorhizobium numidicum]WEX75157.1 hypothetical protein PYH37_000522 [Sinorhizobium numidicum]WEX81150.1 hypothetical protein PYH38_000524 [Sinorhizobium numidicum]
MAAQLMKMSRFGFLFLLLISMVQRAAASSDEVEKFVIAALDLSEFETMPAEQRRQLVEASLAYWKNFDSRVPRNSPADAEWFLSELDTTDTTRIGRAINTPAYALMQLSDLDCCLVDFKNVPQKTTAAGSFAGEWQTEMDREA